MIPKKPGGNGTPGDSKPTDRQKRGKKAPKRHSPAVTRPTATGTPPSGSEAPTGPIPADLEARAANAIEVGRRAGLMCTGSPDQPVCDAPAYVGIIVGRVLWSLPCRDHLPDVLRPLLTGGRDDVRTASLAHLLEIKTTDLVHSCRYIRQFNHANGVHIPARGE